VPLPLIGPVAVLNGLKIDNNLHVQIGLLLLIALSAKMPSRSSKSRGEAIIAAAVDAARARFRPILMTSFAFILRVAPLVFATGAGASARKSIGITVFSGMLASTCLAVLLVPAFFVVVQRLEEWRVGKGGNSAPHWFSSRALARMTSFPPGSTAWMNCPPRVPSFIG
jgi:hydrophobic/amphiphilic exporter-1 (mainly G- bacteria), HAE1 family